MKIKNSRLNLNFFKIFYSWLMKIKEMGWIQSACNSPTQ